MRTRTTTDTLYTYEELSDDAKEKARETIGQQNLEWLDSGDLAYMFEQIIEEWGFPSDDIQFSLGYSQGDGVAFYGSIDVDTYLRKAKRVTHYKLLKTGVEYWFTLKRNSWGTHYSHHNTMDLVYDATPWDWDKDLDPKRQALLEELYEELLEKKDDLSHECEWAGYKHMEWLCSDEYIAEQCEANEYEFLEDGSFA